MTNITIGTKKEFFTWLPNDIVYESGLSAEALAVALYLNGKPAGWQARPFDIQSRFKWGTRLWRKVSKELKEAGLLHEKKHRDGTSLWFELPDASVPVVKNPPLQNSTVLKPTVTKCHPLTNKDITDKDLLTKKDILRKNEIETIFSKMWEMYPLKKARVKALEAFIKLLDGKPRVEAEKLAMEVWEGFTAHVAEHRAKKDLEAQGAKMWVPELPYLSTWLNQGRWSDSYSSPEDILAAARPKSSILDINTVF